MNTYMSKEGNLYSFHRGDKVAIYNRDKNKFEGYYTFKETHIITIEHGLIYIGNKYYEIYDIDIECNPVEIKIENLDNRPGMLEINIDELKKGGIKHLC